MNFTCWITAVFVMVVMSVGTGTGHATEPESLLEKSMSEALDIWRDGRFELLFEKLAHRGKTSRESFIKKMRESTIRPACCWQKLENFKILNEKRTEATVYAKVGLEGTSDASASMTREFKLTHMEGVWKMQLADVLSIAGVTGKNNNKKRHVKNSSPYHN